MSVPAVLVVTGATCTGKTNAAARIAAELGGEVVCCDSRQLFRGMEIGSAQPGDREREAVPHHLYGSLEPRFACSAGAYRDLAEPALRDIVSRSRLPILVGGTGLYLRALLGDMSLPPPSAPETIKAAQGRIDQLGLEGAWRELKACDPETAAKVHQNDRYRIARALSVFMETGRPISEWRRRKSEPRFRAVEAGLLLDRNELYSRIDERCERMLNSGMREEAERLREGGYSECPPVKKAIGYGHLFSMLDGKIDGTRALSLFRRDTRRYAKRQMTWLRAQTRLKWADSSDPESAARSVIRIFRAEAGP